MSLGSLNRKYSQNYKQTLLTYEFNILAFGYTKKKTTILTWRGEILLTWTILIKSNDLFKQFFFIYKNNRQQLGTRSNYNAPKILFFFVFFLQTHN